MAKYYKLKDQKSSQGCMVAGVMFNNSTVKAYETTVPSAIQIAVRNGQLTEAKESEYKEFLRLQEIAIENGKAAKLKKEAENLKRLAAATGKTVEEIVEKKKEVAAENEKAESEKEKSDNEEKEGADEKENAEVENKAPKKEKSNKKDTTKGE